MLHNFFEVLNFINNIFYFLKKLGILKPQFKETEKDI